MSDPDIECTIDETCYGQLVVAPDPHYDRSAAFATLIECAKGWRMRAERKDDLRRVAAIVEAWEPSKTP